MEKTALHDLDLMNEAIRVTQESCHEIRQRVIAAEKESVHAEGPIDKEEQLRLLDEKKKKHHIVHFLKQSGVHEVDGETHESIAERKYDINLKHPSEKWQTALAEISDIENTVTNEEKKQHSALRKLCNELHYWRVQHEKYLDNPAHVPSMRALHRIHSDISKAHYLIAEISHHDVEKKEKHLKKSVEASNKSIFYHAVHHAQKEGEIEQHLHNEVPEGKQRKWNIETQKIDPLVQRLHESLDFIRDVNPHSDIPRQKRVAQTALEELTVVRKRMREYSQLFAKDIALHSAENRNALKSRQSTLKKLALDVSAKVKSVAEEEERRIETGNKAFNDIFQEAMTSCDQMDNILRVAKRSDESQKKIQERIKSIIRRLRDPTAQKHAKDGRLSKIVFDTQLNQLRVEHSGVESQVKSLKAQLKTVQVALKRLKQQENLVTASNADLNPVERRIFAEERNHYRELARRVHMLNERNSGLNQLVNFNIRIARTINFADKLSDTVFDRQASNKDVRKVERERRITGVHLPQQATRH